MSNAATTTPDAPSIQEGASSVLSTLNDDGSRRWINPRPSQGRFLTRRRAVAIGLIALFTMLPHVQIGGKPAMEPKPRPPVLP